MWEKSLVAIVAGLVTIGDGVVRLEGKQLKRNGDIEMAEEEIGKVSDFFARPVVAAFELTAALKVGDTIRIKGHTTDLELEVDSIQIENAAVQEAKAGDSIGVKVSERVRKGDTVYKIVE